MSDPDFLDGLQENPEESTDLRVQSRRSRRAALMRAADGSGPAESAGVDGDSSVPAATVQKLTKAQRAIVVRVIAIQYDVALVQDTLKEEHPEIPTVSDEQIRYYRRQIDSGAIKDLDEARAQAATAGLMRREVRVAHLVAHLKYLGKQLRDSGRVMNNPLVPQLSREYRETLAQLRQEADPLIKAGKLPAAVPGSAEDELEADMAMLAAMGNDIVAFFAGIVEQRQAKDEALAGAQRPARVIAEGPTA